MKIGLICAILLPLASFAEPVLLPSPQEMKLSGGVCTNFASPVFAIDSSLPKEGYRLIVTPSLVRIFASEAAGGFWARQTLHQLVTEQGGRKVVPCVEIRDWPAFSWRGFLLDVSRHFFTVDEVKRVLDQMAAHKLNVFHWHLTDGPGWRIQIDRYPELTRRGATRNSQKLKRGRYSRDVTDSGNGKYGPYFYTKAQVREIVAYATDRHIRVMPEIEIPGHSGAATLAYPNLGCGGRCSSELCIGNDEVLRTYENILDEVVELFPDPFIHIGGDECSMQSWAKCAQCQARKRQFGLKSERELQYWITRHFADYLAKKHRRILGWDEIALADLPASSAVMKWRNGGKADDAARRGHDIVLTSSSLAYVDYPQGLRDDPTEYVAFAGNLTAARMYTLDPYAGMEEAIRPRLLGGEGAAWTEVTASMEELEWKSWPRMGVVAEVFWRNESVASRKADAFLKRLAAHRQRLVAEGINAAPLGPLGPNAVEVEPGKSVGWGGSVCPVVCDEITAATDGIRPVNDATVGNGHFRISANWQRVEIRYGDEKALADALGILNRIARPLGNGAKAIPAMEYSK